MVDIETTGTLPDRHAILQISAVKFNLKTGAVSPDFFDRCLIMPKHRSWDEGTRNWWIDKKSSIINDIFDRAEDHRVVIDEFAKWAYPQNHLQFWSKPTHFDFMFLSSYFHDENIQNPFHYRFANDLNSYLRGLYYPKDVPNLNLEFKGDAHNALADTLHQLRLLFAHMKDVEAPSNQLEVLNEKVTDAVIDN